MLRPSCWGRCSMTASSPRSSASRLRIISPRSGWAISRPRNMIVTLTLSRGLQEALDVALLGVVVVLGDLRPGFDLTDVDLGLVLARGLLLLVLLVLVLRVVQDPADGRLGLGRHLDEVEIASLGLAQGLLRLHDADLRTGLVDETDLGNADAFVDPGRVAFRRLPVEPARDRHYESFLRRVKKCAALCGNA